MSARQRAPALLATNEERIPPPDQVSWADSEASSRTTIQSSEPFLTGGQTGRHNRFRREATSDQSLQEFQKYYSSSASDSITIRANISLQQRRQGPQEVEIWSDTGAEVDPLTEGSFRTCIPDEVVQPTAKIFKGITRARQPTFGRVMTEASFQATIPDVTCKFVPPRLEPHRLIENRRIE